MTEQEREDLGAILRKPVMVKALNEAAIALRRTSMDSVEQSALSHAFNNGLLAGLNKLFELGKVKNEVTATTRKLKYGND